MAEYIDVLNEDGRAMRAYKALPTSGRGPVVVVLQEIFGVNAAMRAVADDLATNGYVALVPDLFWRIQPELELGYDEAGTQQAVATWKRFDLDRGVDDAVASLKCAHQLSEGTGKVAIMGFCLGGQIAVKAAARAEVDAIVSFYGVRLGESRGEIESLSAPAQFHFGDADTHFSPETRKAITEVASTKPGVELHIYPGAQHAFYNAFRQFSYDAAASALARTRFMGLLRTTLMTPAVA